MKIILSIDPVRFPLTGIGRYTFELARHLKEIAQIEQLRFFSGYRFTDDLPKAVQSSKPNIFSPSNLGRTILKNSLTVEMYRLISTPIKRYALRGYSDYVYHGPNFYLPSFEGPSVCTFHDLSMFTWAHCSPPERVKYMRKEITLTLKRTDMLITDSEYTRQEVAAYFGWPLEKIRAVPLACSADFRPRTANELIPVLRKHGLNLHGYSLYVGTIEPRKNLDVLLDAYTLLPPSVRQQWPLVLIGYHGWRSEHLHARIKAAVSEGWVHYLGFVDTDELPLIYAGARVFVFPSLYEGFGLPVLEAMASGIPVVCSNASTLPEVAGDAAAMCEPQDVEALSNLIVMGLEDEIWRGKAIKKGLLQAAGFSWKRCAEETLAVYREVI
ncbi:glycosyltransferase family 1 protein [Methylobacter sp. S3L5C]|uniref:glycosyltransferase family 4 protein n=1 Tax=Methylobacter sp. S3L5C TaxID=2839024 RepID=UPI001FAC7AE9|nr:glycosyltransferase family 1 protein [Methylobacter sp. S3L5C]UOA09541.1 glycosyltransferase family 4 protein [Methylobacter sp. S3L5C]